MTQDLDSRVTELHFSDTITYRRVSQKEFVSQYKQLDHVWTVIGRQAGLDKNFVLRLKVKNPYMPVFYSLLKTHKLLSTSAKRYQ